MNKELLELLLKLGFGVVIIMAAIALCALLTPKIAKLYEKNHPPADPSPERVDDKKLSDNNEPPEVKRAVRSSERGLRSKLQNL